jgi:Zn finger protein HypA/HybF involved in hydrogenase expression
MALIPKMEENEKKIQKLVDGRLKKAEEERQRKVNELVDKKLKEAEEERRKNQEIQVDENAKRTASRIVKAIDLIKGEKEEKGEGIQKNPNSDIVTAGEHGIGHKNDVLCPTCHQGHVHGLEQGGKSYELVCNEGKCKMEWVMIPKDPDYKCLNCGGPLKRPEEGMKLENCPYCEKKSKAIRYDWSKQLGFTKMLRPAK